MSPVLTTFLFEIVNFLFLVLLVGWLLFKPVRAALQAKQDAETRRRKELDARTADIERQRTEIDERLRAFETDIERKRQEHAAAATQEAAAIRAQAREATERERESVTRMLSQLEGAQLAQLSDAVAMVTRDAVARLLTTLDAADLDTSLVHAACRRLAFDGTSLGAVLVESALPLDEAARAALTAAFDGRAHPVDFRVVPDLGGGLRIVTSKGLIDASVRGIAREAERLLSDTLAMGASEATT